MTGSALNDVQKAIYELLTGDAPFMLLAKAVLDYVPDAQSYPYVTIGEATEIPFDTFGNDGYEQTLSLHIWDQGRGFKVCYDILDSMTTLIEGATLALTSHQQVLTNSDNVTSLREADGITHHVVARYRIIVQDN